MKKQLLLTTLLGLLFSSAIGKINIGKEKELSNKLNQRRIDFTENKGQVYDQNYKPRPDVLYGTMTGDMAVHIKTTGVSYQLYKVDTWKDIEDKLTKEKRHKEIEKQTIYRVDLNWLNANTNFTTSQDETLPGYNNYYLESCPNGALNVKSYTGITLHNLYNGINLHFYESGGNLKYDYIVAPHANYKQIQILVEGADIELNKDGSINISTPLGKIREGAPIVYQNNVQLKSKWLVKNNILSFEIENYDPKLQLIIDPFITRLWGSYYGGSGYLDSFKCATDASGNVFFAACTTVNTTTIIATTGSHQETLGGNMDSYLVKFNSLGIRQWSTYYGGASNEGSYACCVDPFGNVYLGGGTWSSGGTVIATLGSHQATYGGGHDGFLVKFNTSGVRQWGTYYGGTGSDGISSCCTDASGNVYIAGTTTVSAGTSIATSGGHQISNGGMYEAYLAKFNSSGIRQWGTYYGGSGDDFGSDCCTDPSGNIYLSGQTSASVSSIIATTGAHQVTFSGGGYDAFLVKFNSLGARIWGTYYGGSGNDAGQTCISDISGNIYLGGFSMSSGVNVIATPGSHQSFYGGGADGYLVKFNSVGTRQWGTYYGTTGTNIIEESVTDASGNIYVAGRTNNSSAGTVIATIGSHQTTYGGGSSDAYLAKFNSTGIRQWGTYYGGNGIEEGWDCSIDPLGNIYLGGVTTSSVSSTIATTGAHQINYSGSGYDAFIVKFKNCNNLNPVITANSSACIGALISFSTSITGTTIPTYNWNGPNSFTSSIQNPSFIATGASNIGIYTLSVNNGGCIETTTTQIIAVNPKPIVNAVSSSTNFICIGQSATLTANGAANYTWNPGGAGSSITISPTITTSYTVTGIDGNGCSNIAVISQSVSACTGINEFNNVSVVEIYPNPVTETLHINLGNLNPSLTTIEVVNSIGQLVYSTKADSTLVNLNLSVLSNGVYVVKVLLNNKETINHKLIKN